MGAADDGRRAGALNATFLASRADVPADTATKELLDLWLGIGRKHVFDDVPFAGLKLLGQELGLPVKPLGVVDIGYFEIGPEDLGGREWVFDQPFFIILNLALGGTLGGTIGLDLEFPIQYYVDYVRVYQPVSAGQ